MSTPSSHTPVLQPKSHQTRSFANHTNARTSAAQRSTFTGGVTLVIANSRIPLLIASALVWCRDRRQGLAEATPIHDTFGRRTGGDSATATSQTAAARASETFSCNPQILITKGYPFGPRSRWRRHLHGCGFFQSAAMLCPRSYHGDCKPQTLAT